MISSVRKLLCQDRVFSRRTKAATQRARRKAEGTCRIAADADRVPAIQTIDQTESLMTCLVRLGQPKRAGYDSNTSVVGVRRNKAS
jgi:hypothetical protein